MPRTRRRRALQSAARPAFDPHETAAGLSVAIEAVRSQVISLRVSSNNLARRASPDL